MNYSLSYVNMPNTEHYLDKDFESMAKIEAFVADTYKGWTSYQVIVVNRLNIQPQ